MRLKEMIVMKKIFLALLFILLSFTELMSPYQVNAKEELGSNKQTYSKSALNLKLNERKLWSDHVLWTRNFIISDLASLEDKDKVLERLLKNQDDIGESIKPYYGEDNGKKLAQLLREHIIIAGQVVNAAKSNKKDDLVKYNELWYKNADKIADFLSSLNSKWSKPSLKDALDKHLLLTTSEVVARLNKSWDEDIISYDKGEGHILTLADLISQGIINQFPEKFN